MASPCCAKGGSNRRSKDSACGVEEHVVYVGGPTEKVLRHLNGQGQGEAGQDPAPEARQDASRWCIEREHGGQPAERDEYHDVAQDVDDSERVVDIVEFGADPGTRMQVRAAPETGVSAAESDSEDGEGGQTHEDRSKPSCSRGGAQPDCEEKAQTDEADAQRG